MAVRVLIMSIMSIVLWMIQLSQVASNLNPKPKCNTEYCGGVQISYPFGISKNCYYDKSFEIECKDIKQTEVIDGTPQLKPYLKIIDLEVMDINGNDLKVIVPVNFTSCKDAISDYDLRATPFSFSSSNIFVGVGCNIIAYTTDRDDDISVWCDPGVCNLDSNSNVCAIKLKQNIQRLSPMVQSTIDKTVIISNRTRNQKDACGFGYLVDENLFSYNIQSQQHAVVNMEWELYNVTSASFGVDNVTTSCETKPQWFQVNNMFYSNSSLQCSCRHGYEGDPYRPKGCQDVSSAIGALVLVFLVWWLYKVVRKEIIRKKKEKYFIRNGGLLLKQQISSNDGSIEKTKVFSSYELEKATDDYNVDRVLGQGGQGTVYKGMLSNGKIIAVKKSKILDTTKVGQFINEVVILSQINHKNVVKLLGCCLETEVPLLVYEFISNGTLFQHIHDPNEDLPLTWDMRLRIATEIAGALSYMHSAASMPIYHRDIKSTNILLDEKYKAKVSDFGISRSVDVDRTHLTTLVQGTFGYLDPEYFQSSQFTEKSDVYSFGVVLVELLTGQKPIFSNTSQEFRGLAPHFLELMEQNNFLEMIDQQISKEGKIEEMTVVAHLAKMCLNSERKKRPTMKEVGVQLERIRISRENDVAQGYSGIIENNTIDPLAKAYDTSSTSTESWSEISTASSPEEYQLYIGK